MTESFRPTNIRAQARRALTGNWGGSAAVCLLYLAIILAVSSTVTLAFFPAQLVGISILEAPPSVVTKSNIANIVIGLFFSNILAMGVMFIWLDVSRGVQVRLETMFEAFRDYLRYVLAGALVLVYTFLWSLLFLIPGIVKFYSYSMTYYIMRDNPGMDGEEAIRLSMQMMRGRKANLFLLHLSFIGWGLLCLLTCGIGFLWLSPYIYTAQGRFYDTLKEDYAARRI